MDETLRFRRSQTPNNSSHTTEDRESPYPERLAAPAPSTTSSFSEHLALTPSSTSSYRGRFPLTLTTSTPSPRVAYRESSSSAATLHLEEHWFALEELDGTLPVFDSDWRDVYQGFVGQAERGEVLVILRVLMAFGLIVSGLGWTVYRIF